MKIQLTVDDEQVIADVDPDLKLLSFLRGAGRMSAKQGCTKGICGSCTVLLNDDPVPSCIVPMAATWNAAIVTLEHFSQSAVYADIRQGFQQAGAFFCGFCNAGKIFAAYQLLKNRGERLEREHIIKTIETLSCHCADSSRVADGIFIAANLGRKREEGTR